MTQQITWHDVIGQEKAQDYFLQTMAYVTKAREQGTVVYPPKRMCLTLFASPSLPTSKW